MHLWEEVEVAVKHAAAQSKEGLEKQEDNARIKRCGFFWSAGEGGGGGGQGRFYLDRCQCVSPVMSCPLYMYVYVES